MKVKKFGGMTYDHQYLIRLQYLGFRYSGWQRQPRQRTVEGMVVKTLTFVLPERKYKVLASGRTDAKVSAQDAAFELFLSGEPLQLDGSFLSEFNRNLPPDIRAMEIHPVSADFNIIRDAREKEYVYLFSNTEKFHPYCAPFLANFPEPLDLDLMMEKASCFVGQHDFVNYTVKDPGKDTVRTITSCVLGPNDLIHASFFPEKSYAFRVRGSGFLRYQVRMMVGALVDLGRGRISEAAFDRSLQDGELLRLAFVAPGSGLLLQQTDFGYL